MSLTSISCPHLTLFTPLLGPKDPHLAGLALRTCIGNAPFRKCCLKRRLQTWRKFNSKGTVGLGAGLARKTKHRHPFSYKAPYVCDNTKTENLFFCNFWPHKGVLAFFWTAGAIFMYIGPSNYVCQKPIAPTIRCLKLSQLV